MSTEIVGNKTKAIIILIIAFLFLILTTLLGLEFERQKEEQSSSTNLCTEIVGNVDKAKATELWQGLAKGTKMDGKIPYMIKSAQKHKIDPAIFIAISYNETGGGTSQAVETHNNVAGMMGSGDLFHFDTIEEGIDAAAKNLYDLYFKEGLNTPEKIGPKYAPVGASNDPTNLNANWIPGVKKVVSQISDNKSPRNKADKPKKTDCDNGVPVGSSIEKLKKYKGNLPKYSGKRFEPNTYLYKQCTWYVYNRRKELGLPVELTFGNGADWDERAKAQGYKVGKEPKVGAMVSWPYNSIEFGPTTYGHIAFVEKVYSDGRIKVSEHNIIPLAYGERTFKPASDLTYIY